MGAVADTVAAAIQKIGVLQQLDLCHYRRINRLLLEAAVPGTAVLESIKASGNIS